MLVVRTLQEEEEEEEYRAIKTNLEGPMSCGAEAISMGFMTVATNSTTAVSVPTGSWRSSAGYTYGRGWGEMRGKNGNISVEPGLQLTNDVADPTAGGTTITLGSALTADGTSNPQSTPISLSVAGYKYARPVWIVKLTSGTTLATAAVTGVIELVR